jgi:hypothetical protein
MLYLPPEGRERNIGCWRHYGVSAVCLKCQVVWEKAHCTARTDQTAARIPFGTLLFTNKHGVIVIPAVFRVHELEEMGTEKSAVVVREESV